ncbi:MAG: 30S ribosomal protein S16 [Patescibacteria group bacterium]
MLMIRFQRIGRKNDAAFRMAVLPKASGPKAGKYVDLVGTYNPKTKAITVDAEKIKDWVSKGAQMSPSLHNLLVKNGTIEGTKTAKVVSKKSLEKNIKAKAEADAKEAAAKAAADAKAAEAAKAEAEAAAQAAAAEAEAPAAEEVVAEAPTEEAAPATEETPAA